MKDPKTRFEAWKKDNYGTGSKAMGSASNFAWLVWQAAEVTALELAAEVVDNHECTTDNGTPCSTACSVLIAAAIRELKTVPAVSPLAEQQPGP